MNMGAIDLFLLGTSFPGAFIFDFADPVFQLCIEIMNKTPFYKKNHLNSC
jgi:hypothetical protein